MLSKQQQEAGNRAANNQRFPRTGQYFSWNLSNVPLPISIPSLFLSFSFFLFCDGNEKPLFLVRRSVCALLAECVRRSGIHSLDVVYLSHKQEFVLAIWFWTLWKTDVNIPLSHELGNDWVSERAKEWAVRANERAHEWVALHLFPKFKKFCVS